MKKRIREQNEHCHDEHCHEHDEHCHDEHCHDSCCHDEHCHEHNAKYMYRDDDDRKFIPKDGFECGCSCACCRDDVISESDAQNEREKRRFVWIKIIVSFLLMIVGAYLLSKDETWAFTSGLIASLAAYVLCGYDTLFASVKSIFSGKVSAVFDENLLMSVATICAILIGEYAEAAAVMVLFKLGETLEDIAVTRSRRGIREVLTLCNEQARIIKDGKEVMLSPEEVNIGDVIYVKPGERVPLDGKALNPCVMNYAAITGESMPVSLEEGASVLSGGICGMSPLSIEVTALYHDSMASRIMQTVEDAKEGKPRLEGFIRRFSRYYTPAVMLLALVIAILPPLLLHDDWSTWIHRGLLFLVVSCPCALVIGVPLTFFAGLNRGAANGVIFKSASMLENLSNARVLAFDKTGTLTTGELEMHDMVTNRDFIPRDVICMAGALERDSLHPIAKAIVKAASEYKEFNLFQGSEYKETLGLGVNGIVNGSSVIIGNRDFMVSKNLDVNEVPLDFPGVIYVAIDGNIAGAMGFRDELRRGVPETISSLRAQGKKIALLTGDNLASAASVAKLAGIHEDEIYAGLLPGEKLEVLKKLRQQYGKVAFMGDGSNDAPVLAGSDVGLVMGVIGTDAAIDSADVMIMGDNFGTLISALDTSKRVRRTAWFNVAFALFIKFVAMVLGVLGLLQMWMAVIADVGTTLLCVLFAAGLADIYHSNANENQKANILR